MFRRILVPLDFSGSSAAALALARRAFPQATLRLVHVLNPSQIAGNIQSPAMPELTRFEMENEVRQRLEELTTDADELVIRLGNAAELIIKEAEAWQADLITMGTHGRTGLNYFLQGSVAEQVVRHSRLPVLIEHDRPVQPA